MKVAVVTPYHRSGCQYIDQCIESVSRQTHACVNHILVGDGCGKVEGLSPNVHNFVLPHRFNDYGDSPRSLGVMYGFSLGCDAVCFLDSDNWYETDHISSLVQLMDSSGSNLAISDRNLCHLNGELLGACPDNSKGFFCDTNCLMVSKSLAQIVSSWWLMPGDHHCIGDRVIWDRLIHSTDKLAFSRNSSVNYRTSFCHHYRMFGVNPPEEGVSGLAIAEKKLEIASLQKRAKDRLLNMKIFSS